MATIINTKLGNNRGKKRLWLEGVKLEREGYLPGMQFNLTVKDSSLFLTLAEGGTNSVSKRSKNGRLLPIIDLSGRYLSELFPDTKTLRVYIHNGVIVVSAHHYDELEREREERLKKKISTGEPLSVASLFHGGGVLDKSIHHGFKRSGLHTAIAVAVERERSYIDASLMNNSELWTHRSIVIESPIELVNLQRNPPPVEVLVAGIPCTGASKAGRSKNKLAFAESHQSAGALFYDFLRFSELLNPSVIIIENVPEYANTASMAVIRSVLEVRGYIIQERIFDGNEFGALEKRKRLCAVAVSRNIVGDFSIGEIEPLRNKEAFISDILEPIFLDSERWKPFDYLAEKEIRDKAAGKGFSRQLLTGQESYCGTIGRDYAKCRSTEPFILHPVNKLLSRIFTAKEHARLKAIPQTVIAGQSETVAHQILGQSIVYPVFEAIGAYIAKHLLSLLDVLKHPVAA